MRSAKLPLALLSAALLAFGLLAFTEPRPSTRTFANDASGDAPAPSWLEPDERRRVEVFERTARSVVHIRNMTVRRDWFSFDVSEQVQGSGTGFAWDNRGHIVTNFHVVAGAHSIVVILDDQTAARAEVVGVAPDKDLAVLKIAVPGEKIPPLQVADSSLLRVGMNTLAIGHPFGLDHSLTRGIISALGREIRSLTGRTITDVIQTDAAINRGNSGGPLLDSRGYLIGVNTAIVSPSGTSAGVGFAVPSNTVRRVVTQIIEYGRVIRPGLGISPYSDATTRRAGIPRGVLLRRVYKGSSAEKAGLRDTKVYRNGDVELGDVILRIDEHNIDTTEDLLNTLDRYRVGDAVKVTYLRDGEESTTRAVLQAVD